MSGTSVSRVGVIVRGEAAGGLPTKKTMRLTLCTRPGMALANASRSFHCSLGGH